MLNFEMVLNDLIKNHMVYEVEGNVISLLLADNGYDGIMTMDWLDYYCTARDIRGSEDGYGEDYVYYLTDGIVIIGI